MISLTPAERSAIVSSVSSSLLQEGREAYHAERVEEMIRDFLPLLSYTEEEAAELAFQDEQERRRITASIMEEIQEKIAPVVIYREIFNVFVAALDDDGDEIDRQEVEIDTSDYRTAHKRARDEARDYFHPGNDWRWRRWVVDRSKRRRAWEPAIREVSIGVTTERVGLDGDPIPDILDLPSFEEEEEIRIRRDLLKEVEEIENYIGGLS